MTLTWTVEKPAWRCGVDVGGAEALELAAVAVRASRRRPAAAGASASSSWRNRQRLGSKSRSATQSPLSSSST